MGLFETLLQVSAHPAAQPFLQQLLGGNPQDRRARELADLRQALQETTGRATATAAAVEIITPAPDGPAPDLAPVRDQLLRVSGALKESLRFAREDGMAHPEVQQRLTDSQQWAVDLERYQLRPEVLVALPPAARQQAEALLPSVRRLRQQIGAVESVDSLTAASALAGQLATQAQVATAVGAMPGHPPDPSDPGPAPYSRYAPDMPVDTSCLACGRSHLAGVQGALEQAAHDAATRGWGDPAVQDRVTMAQEELSALLDYDWTPAKIAAAPAAEQAVVRPAVAGAQQLLRQLQAARQPGDLATAATQAQALRTQIRAADAPVYGALVLRPLTPSAGTARVMPERVWFTATEPPASAVQVLAPPIDTHVAFDNLTRALAARGIPVRIRQLPATETHILEGQYSTDTNTVTLAPFVLAKDSYAVQTLQHEAAHALLHGFQCLPHPPEDHTAQERQAEDTVILSMVESGLPIETREGTLLEPGTRAIDWTVLEQEVGPATAENLRWASQWVVDATQGRLSPDRISAPCPHPSP